MFWRGEGLIKYVFNQGAATAAQMFADMPAARDQENGPQSLLSVHSSRRGCGASDLRDIIFGHLAVANLPFEIDEPPCPNVD